MISRRGFVGGLAAALAGSRWVLDALLSEPTPVRSFDSLDAQGRDDFERTGHFGPLVDDKARWPKQARWEYDEYLPHPSSPVWRS